MRDLEEDSSVELGFDVLDGLEAYPPRRRRLAGTGTNGGIL
jgi:hypothetical protein